MSGTANGVIRFLDFTLSALVGPAFSGGLARASGSAAERTLEQYQTTRETGPEVPRPFRDLHRTESTDDRPDRNG